MIGWGIVAGLAAIAVVHAAEMLGIRRLGALWRKEQQRKASRGMPRRRFGTSAVIGIGLGLAAAALWAGFDGRATVELTIVFAILAIGILSLGDRLRAGRKSAKIRSGSPSSGSSDPIVPE